ncbi:MAG: 50S ribosomal protein L2 [Candidatus Marinimicrobia bacterium]|nr:50S ribosomal protein L2 [Candidatus Neomarinimicrobiota bacterium]
MKKYKPTTPSRRHMTGIEYRAVLGTTENNPLKSLTKGKRAMQGRNNKGRITTRHKGGGAKRLYRMIDFRYDKKDIPAKVETIEYDPNRSGFIALLTYADGEKRYILAPQGLKKGDKVIVSEKAELKIGNRLPLSKIPSGTHVYNIEFQPNAGAKLVRSAGNFSELLAHDAGYAQLKMPSKEVRKILDTCWASIGAVSNEEYNLVTIGKAGRSRWKGIRPTVRGSAMNPCDHPYGGGEGRQPQGTKRPKNKWGKGTRGVKTRNKNKYSAKMIIKRRVKRKRK